MVTNPFPLPITTFVPLCDQTLSSKVPMGNQHTSIALQTHPCLMLRGNSLYVEEIVSSDLTSWPLAASQMQGHFRYEYDTVCLPSGEKATDLI